MQQFFEFMINHWFLWTLFFALALTLIWQEMNSQAGGGAAISPSDAVNLMNKENAVVFDIRSLEQFDKGHITNAVHATETFLQDAKKLSKYKNKTVLVTCETGQRAGKIAQQLQSQGIAKVYVLKGGVQAWRQNSLPLIKEKAVNSVENSEV